MLAQRLAHDLDFRRRAQDLARASAVGVATIRRAELAERVTSMTAPNDMAVRRALESANVEFIDENGGGPGVRLRKWPKELDRTDVAICCATEPVAATKSGGGPEPDFATADTIGTTATYPDTAYSTPPVPRHIDR